jgi:hypothetical protein
MTKPKLSLKRKRKSRFGRAKVEATRACREPGTRGAGGREASGGRRSPNERRRPSLTSGRRPAESLDEPAVGSGARSMVLAGCVVRDYIAGSIIVQTDSSVLQAPALAKDKPNWLG